MNMETPLHRQYVVSGALHVVLRLSQLLGVAPLKFRHTRDGWLIRVSHNYGLYGGSMVVLFVIILMITVVGDVVYREDSANAQIVTWVWDALGVGIVAVIGAYTGVDRMSNMIESLSELKQLNQGLKHFCQPTFRNNWIELFAMTALISGAILLVVDYCVTLYSSIVNNTKVIVASVYIFYYLIALILYLLVFQFFLITMSILATQKALNNCFKEVIEDLQNNKSIVSTFTALYRETVYQKDETTIQMKKVSQEPFNDESMKILEGVQSVPRRLNYLVQMYGTISDVIQKIEHSHGPLLVAVLLSVLFHMVITLYSILYTIAHYEFTELPAIMQLPWALHQLSKLVMVIEPCHRSHDQLTKTKRLIVRMMRYIRHDDFAIIFEVKTFLRHLALSQARYSPMQLFTLDRTVIVTMLGSITTYLVIVIHL